MQRLKPFLILLLYVLLMLTGFTSNAQTLAQLQQANRVQVKVWIEPEDNIIARQQLNLQIEVATDKWFSGGTRIGRFEIADAIVLQREKFAVNSSRNEGGKSWAVQLWTLAVYPLRDGVFEVPQIPLQLSIAGENLQVIVGDTSTRAFSFIASIPAQIAVGDNWIATRRFEIEESFDKSLDELAPGDALIRTIKIFADNLPAMMLPEVLVDNIPGIAIYPKPPQLTDKINRGDTTAERTQTITYVFEKAGEYRLAKQRYYWWNLESQSYESAELDEHKLTISHMTNKPDSDGQMLQSENENVFAALLSLIIKAAVPVLLLLGIWIAVRKYYARHKNRAVKPAAMTEAGLRKQFEQACAKADSEKALALFYQWLDFYGGENFRGSIRKYINEMEQTERLPVFNGVLQSIYAKHKNRAVDLSLFAHQFISEIRNNEHQTLFDRLSVDLKLN